VTSELAQDGVCYFLITCHCFVAVFIVLPPLFNLLFVLFFYCKDRKTKINAQVFAHLFYV
jgi:hypothetical protein